MKGLKDTRMDEDDEKALQECLEAEQLDRALGATEYAEEQRRIQELEE